MNCKIGPSPLFSKLLQKRVAELEKYESERNVLEDKVIRHSVELSRINVDLQDKIIKGIRRRI